MRARVIGSLLCATAVGVPASAGAETQSYIDLQAGLGYATNPLLVSGDNTGSAFGRLSAYGFYGWNTERSSTSVSAFVENSTYFRRYSNKQIFNLAAHTDREWNERVRVFGDLSFSGDFGGQLSSRFNSVPSAPVIPDPAVPDSFIVVDPELFGLSGRQYRLSGQVGASVVVSARDSMTVSAGAQRIFAANSPNSWDYMQYDGSVGYERQINERLTVGGRAIAQYSNYSNGRSVTSFGPQATIRARLSEQWDATAALGFVRTQINGGSIGDDESSIDLALDGSLCRNLEFERICARVARRSQSTVLGGAPTSTSADVDYYRRLSARDTVQGSVSIARSSGIRLLGVDQRSTFYSLAGSYDRKLNDRLSGGANLAARRLVRLGPDPKTDLSGSFYLRYRIGDVR
jgi:hypothetical protein